MSVHARHAYLILERALRSYLAAHGGYGFLLVCAALAFSFSPRVSAQDTAGKASSEVHADVAPGAEAADAAAAQAPPERALKHYERGREHYRSGRYRDALLELEIAVNLDPKSQDLVYNVARVYELLGEIDHAIAFYRRYLDMLPAQESLERERTVTTLQRLEGARHVVDHAPKPVVTIRKRGVADAPFWTLASLSAVALVGSGTTGVLALMGEHDTNRFRLGEDGSAKRRNHLVERTEHLALASDVMLLAGVSLGVTAVLLFALRERTVVAPKKEPVRPFQFAVSATHNGAFLAFEALL